MDFLQIMGNHSSIGKKEKRTEINERSVRVNLNIKKGVFMRMTTGMKHG